MLRLILVAGFLFVHFSIFSQIKKATIKYELAFKAEVQYKKNGQDKVRSLSPLKSAQYVLTFDSVASLWKQQVQADKPKLIPGQNGIQVEIGGSKNIIFTDFSKRVLIEQIDEFDSLFILTDTIKPLDWQKTNETLTYLNFKCYKAIATKVYEKTVPFVEDKKFIHKKILDTTTIIAWYTPDIPVSAGPGKYQGQLPGVILELDLDDGDNIFSAIEVTESIESIPIKAPTEGRRCTKEEFILSRDNILKSKSIKYKQ